MAKFVEMDEKVTLSVQMEENIGPVILINKFNVNPEEVDQFLKFVRLNLCLHHKVV
jgi:hypothetical protein